MPGVVTAPCQQGGELWLGSCRWQGTCITLANAFCCCLSCSSVTCTWKQSSNSIQVFLMTQACGSTPYLLHPGFHRTPVWSEGIPWLVWWTKSHWGPAPRHGCTVAAGPAPPSPRAAAPLRAGSMGRGRALPLGAPLHILASCTTGVVEKSDFNYVAALRLCALLPQCPGVMSWRKRIRKGKDPSFPPLQPAVVPYAVQKRHWQKASELVGLLRKSPKQKMTGITDMFKKKKSIQWKPCEMLLRLGALH